MKKIIFTLALLILTTLVFGQKNFIDTNYIEVTGKAEIEITPDLIYLKVLLNEKDNKNKISVSDLEEKMVEKLKEIGIDVSKSLQIKDLSSNFKFYFLTKNEIFLSKEYQILVNNGETAGKVLIGLEKIGISNVSIDKVDYSKMEDIRKEVKINAIKAAK
ncbi:MAG: SIMPL domain-containing protein, partial [Bacteroidota bacterium]|nr:SIMPL domain-containing protein [Bacteroidota bacterium]